MVAQLAESLDSFHVFYLVLCQIADHLSTGHLRQCSLLNHLITDQFCKDTGNKPDILPQISGYAFAVFL